MFASIDTHATPDGVRLITAMQPEYATFAGAFGGWTAALAMNASARLAPKDAQPIALSIDFQKGIGAGEVSAMATVASESKSTLFTSVNVSQADVVCAKTSIIWSRRRDTDHVPLAAFPKTAAPESLEAFTQSSHRNTWVDRFDLRHAHGQLLAKSEHMRSLVWTRFRDEQPLDAARLVTLADASFPRIFYHYDAVAPISTVTMSVHIHASMQAIEAVGNDFLLLEASSNGAQAGFFDQQVRLWTRGGELLATSTQLVWFGVKSEMKSAA
jgi:acyl-CoA thioesterase